MRLLVATSNPHKLSEILAVFESEGAAGSVDLVSLADLGKQFDEPVEDQPTFEGNAIKKALHYAQASNLPTLADDSGLEVDALDGQPGVRSARYAGVEGPRSVVDPRNNQLLLARLTGVPAEERSARFVCTMALAVPVGPGEAVVIAVVRGMVEGRIIAKGESQRGGNGFGYDPLFYLPELGKTMAELSPEHKNELSHRGRASRAIWPQVKELADSWPALKPQMDTDKQR